MIRPSLSHVDALVKESSLLKHPFYVKWSKGELTLEDLKLYACEYYHLARSVPAIVEVVLKQVPEDQDTLKHAIMENMAEEQEHVELWERFAKSLGVSKEELLAYEPTDTVKKAVMDLLESAGRSFESGVAGMYAFECELADIARTKKEGLIAFYNLVSEDAHIYFDEHLGEEEHLQVWRNLPMEESVAQDAAKVAVSAQNRVLDGVCERCGIAMDC